MNTMRLRRAFTIPAIVGALVLAGCTGTSDEIAPEPTPTPTTAPSPSPTEPPSEENTAEPTPIEEPEPEPEDETPEPGTWIDASDRESIAELREEGLGVYQPPTSDEAYVFDPADGSLPQPAREDLEAQPVNLAVGDIYDGDTREAQRDAMREAGLVAIMVTRQPTEWGTDGRVAAVSGYSIDVIGIEFDDEYRTWIQSNGGPVSEATCAGAFAIAQRDADWVIDHPDYPDEVEIFTNVEGC